MTAPRFDIQGEIGEGDATAFVLGAFCDANPGPVEVYLNSYGGVATEGAALFATLERHGDATVIVQGIAASAASLAMLGAKRILMHDAALVMIHEPSTLSLGTADDLREDAAVLDKLSGVYAQLYSRATGNPVDRVAAWMKDETWLSAEEALSLNFCDEVASGENPAPVAKFDYRRFKSAPASLVALALSNGWVTDSLDKKREIEQ